jgi:hypothetical protein
VQPSKLIKYLNQIEADLPDKKHLPFKTENLAKYYTYIKATSTITTNFVIIRFDIPIIGSEKYDLYKIRSFPIKIKNTNSMAVIDMDFNHAAVSKVDNKLYLMTEGEINSCTIKLHQSKICSRYTQEINQHLSLNKCITDKFNNVQNHSCTQFYSIEKLDKTMYFRIAFNKWLFIAPKPEEIKIFCAKRLKDVINVIIEETGTLEIEEDCTIIGKISLTPFKIDKRKFNISIVTDTFGDMEYLTNKFETDKDLLKFKLGGEWNKTSLEFLEKQIKTLDKLANKTIKKITYDDRLYTNNTFLWTITIIVIIIAVVIKIILIVICIKYKIFMKKAII